MPATPGPSGVEIEAHLRRVAAQHPARTRLRRVGVTAEGRPLHAIVVTDPVVPGREKQHVLVTAGHHGNEESGRLIALALLEWLVSPAAAETRRKQRIVIMPNMSPDLAARDQYVPEHGVAPMRDHGGDAPVTPEGAAFARVALALAPELYVDLHARGFAGCSYDMVLWSEPRSYLEDDYLLHRMAAEMGEAGERAGIPNVVHPLSWPGFMSESPDRSSTCAFAYRRFKSLSFLTETCEGNEHSYPAPARARSGLARLQTLLAWGNRRYPKLYYPGYPCYALGMFARGVVAVGRTAAARRRSRVGLWREGGVRSLTSEHPEEPGRKVLKVEYAGQPLTCGIGFQSVVRGRREVERVTLNGRRLRPSETSGYYAWHHGAATYVVVAQRRLHAGTYTIEITHRAR